MEPFYQAITDFIFVEHKPRPSDVIFVPGGSYPDAARRAALLYAGGYAPYVLPSGKYSITKGHFLPPKEEQGQAGEPEVPAAQYTTEFQYLRSILLENGVPDSAILREDRAEYTYQNAIFSRERLEELGISARRGILCCQAFHARRCLLYYQEQFPDTELLVCPVVTKNISRHSWHRTEEGIDTVLGELERCGAQFHQIMREHRANENGISVYIKK